MSFIVTTTGSFPPLKGSSAVSIQNTIEQQIREKIDLLVDGQVGSDIVGLFARSIGLEGTHLPYRIIREIGRLQDSITLPDLQTAAKVADGHPLKVHITGPTVMAESCEKNEGRPERYLRDDGFRNLVLDLAVALADEATMIAQQAERLHVHYLQIDEPSLAFGADLELAQQAIDRISQAWRQSGGGKIILHVCGDIRDILPALARMPVDILNLENVFLREAREEELIPLWDSGKQLALGLIPVNTDKVPMYQRLAREMLTALNRYGANHIWGVTPNCGLRSSAPEKVEARLKNLVDAAQIVRRQHSDNRRRG